MSTIIQFKDYDNDDGYELIIPDMCTYFKVRYPNKNGERVKGNLLIGMEYFSEQNQSEEYKNTYCASCSYGSDVICKVEFVLKDNQAHCRLFNIPKNILKKYKNKFFYFIDIVILYLIEIIQVESIHFKDEQHTHYFFTKNKIGIKNQDILIIRREDIIDLLVNSSNELLFKKKIYSLEENRGLAGRLKQILIPLHKK